MTELSSRGELLRHVSPDDAFARLDPAERLEGWVVDDTVAVLRTSAARPPSLFAWGPRVEDLLAALRPELSTRGVTGVSVPWPQRGVVERLFRVTGGGDWDWMWTRRRCTVSSPVPLVGLDDTRDADEIRELARENPRFEGFPGTGHSERWIGARDADGVLIACGAVQRLPSGTAHLGGILTASRYRRRGLGTAISAALTDAVVADEGVCTLGMYSDNDAARSVYARLGYVTDKAWASRTVEIGPGRSGERDSQ